MKCTQCHYKKEFYTLRSIAHEGTQGSKSFDVKVVLDHFKAGKLKIWDFGFLQPKRTPACPLVISELILHKSFSKIEKSGF